MMSKREVPTTKVGEILYEEFMLPLDISATEIAKKLNLPTLTIQNILYDQEKITEDISRKLGRLFGVSSKYFLNLQNEIELRNIEK